MKWFAQYRDAHPVRVDEITERRDTIRSVVKRGDDDRP